MLKCSCCGAEIEEVEGFDAMERGADSAEEYEYLCEDCAFDLRGEEDDDEADGY